LRYVFYCRDGTPAQADLDLIRSTEGLEVVSADVSRILLAETSKAVAERLRARLPRWVVSEETTFEQQ
jgi:hypothetical protein